MVERERKRRLLVIKYSQKRNNLLQEIKKSSRLETKFDLHRKLQKLPRNSAPTRLHNRCLLTGRPKGYFRDFGLSRQKKLFLYIMSVNKKTLAFDETQRETLRDDYFSSYIISVISYIP